MTSSVPSKRTPVSLLDADVDACSSRREFLAGALVAALPLALRGAAAGRLRCLMRSNGAMGAAARRIAGKW